MTDDTPVAVLTHALPRLPADFRAAHARLWTREHLVRIASRLAILHRTGVAVVPPLVPAERPPPVAAAFAPFAGPMRSWAAAPPRRPWAVTTGFATAVVETGTGGLLVLLGRRLTPGSVTDPRAIPPAADDLLAAALRPHRPGDPVCTAARALARHIARGRAGHGWGPMAGLAWAMNDQTAAVVRRIIGALTWWNVVDDPKLGLVYEARLPSGHGARWQLEPVRFAGFVDPAG